MNKWKDTYHECLHVFIYLSQVTMQCTKIVWVFWVFYNTIDTHKVKAFLNSQSTYCLCSLWFHRFHISDLQKKSKMYSWNTLRSDNFRMAFGCLHLNQKTSKNISVFLPYLSKICRWSNQKKRMQNIILEDN